MQTGSRSGMQTLEQSLADLVVRRVVSLDEALARSSRREELAGLLERSGISAMPSFDIDPGTARGAALRVAGA